MTEKELKLKEIQQKYINMAYENGVFYARSGGLGNYYDLDGKVHESVTIDYVKEYLGHDNFTLKMDSKWIWIDNYNKET